MQGIGNQSNAKNQLKDDGCTRHQKREIEAKKMVAVDINLEPIHVDYLQYCRSDEDEAQQDFQQNGCYGFDSIHEANLQKNAHLSTCVV